MGVGWTILFVIEELKDKLDAHPETKIAGFITNENPTMNKEILERKSEIEDMFAITIRIESLDTWFDNVISEYNIINEMVFLKHWTKIFIEYLCLKQYEIAPIDEPTYNWIEECLNAL